MKHLFIFIGMLLSSVVYSQNCETIEQENQQLKSKLVNLIDTTQNDRIKSFDSNFKVEITSVIGYKDQQAVEIVFVVSHKKVHQQVCVNYGTKDLQAYDDQGNIYDTSHGGIGLNLGTNSGYNSYKCDVVPTSIPVRAAIRLRKVLPTVETIKKVILKIGFKDADGGGVYNYGTLEFDNLKITWE